MCRVQIVCKCTYVYHIQRQRYSHTHRYQMMYTKVFHKNILCTGWRRLIGSPTLHIIFHKRATKYRALLLKMTYKDKGSYESSPPCTNVSCTNRVQMYTHVSYTKAKVLAHTHVSENVYQCIPCKNIVYECIVYKSYINTHTYIMYKGRVTCTFSRNK